MYTSEHREGFVKGKLMNYGLNEQTGDGLRTAGPRGGDQWYNIQLEDGD